MACKGNRNVKTRSSIVRCSEKIACFEPNSEASYQCDDCGSVMCVDCDSRVHGNDATHKRLILKKPQQSIICTKGCPDKNFADISCLICNDKFCNACFYDFHKGDKLKHTKKRFTPTENSEVEGTILSNEFKSVDLVSHNTMMLETQMDGSDNSGQLFKSVSNSLPDVVESGSPDNNAVYKSIKSIRFIGPDEDFQVRDEQAFVDALGVEEDIPVKLVSIFGNTGDGKSYTLNHTFFKDIKDREIFKTCPSQTSCTMGVWAAIDPLRNALILDTEGLLGISQHANKRTRLLLKVLALSDVVIYRTRAERLHEDMFTFLGDASVAFLKHFKAELGAITEKLGLKGKLCEIGPAVIIFQETVNTDILGANEKKHANDLLRESFTRLNKDISAFKSVNYVGTKSTTHKTDFSQLLMAVKSELNNKKVRSSRPLSVVFKALKGLNDKFSGDIERISQTCFPDEYFTCREKCQACHERCSRALNHFQAGEEHFSDKNCIYVHEFDNKVYLCKKCKEENRREQEVVPKSVSSKDNTWVGLAKYAWAGYVLECRYHGIIFQSRQYWYGNEEPDKSVVLKDYRHIWPNKKVLQGTQNAGRKILDGIEYLSESLSTVTLKPTRIMTRWLTDKIAPAYWVPNSEITECRKCGEPFTEALLLHHCRGCGQGFCDDCSSKRRPVPERGWGRDAVRVCDTCFENTSAMESSAESSSSDSSQVQLRKLTEGLGYAVSSVASYPIGALKASSRPEYWVPDHLLIHCHCCKQKFSEKRPLHHCRACGEGVCSECSPARLEVPTRGWDTPVRVCRECEDKDGIL